MNSPGLKPGNSGARHYGIMFAFLAIFFWSTVATAFKLSLSFIGFLPLVFYSALVSMSVLGVLCLVRGKFSQLRTWGKSDYMRSMGQIKLST